MAILDKDDIIITSVATSTDVLYAEFGRVVEIILSYQVSFKIGDITAEVTIPLEGKALGANEIKEEIKRRLITAFNTLTREGKKTRRDK